MGFVVVSHSEILPRTPWNDHCHNKSVLKLGYGEIVIQFLNLCVFFMLTHMSDYTSCHSAYEESKGQPLTSALSFYYVRDRVSYSLNWLCPGQLAVEIL